MALRRVSLVLVTICFVGMVGQGRAQNTAPLSVSPFTVESIGPDHGRLRFTTSVGLVVVADFRSMTMAPAPKGVLVRMIDVTLSSPSMGSPARAPQQLPEFRLVLSVEGGELKMSPAE